MWMGGLDRRDLVRLAGGALLGAGLPAKAQPMAMGEEHQAVSPHQIQTSADHTIRIGTGLVELGPNAIISTKLYNGQFPGPLLRFQEGRKVTVDIHNDTDTAEQLHWHGQYLPAEVDGAIEEATPIIPAHGHRRVSFIPGPSGFRFYHSHMFA